MNHTQILHFSIILKWKYLCIFQIQVYVLLPLLHQGECTTPSNCKALLTNLSLCVESLGKFLIWISAATPCNIHKTKKHHYEVQVLSAQIPGPWVAAFRRHCIETKDCCDLTGASQVGGFHGMICCTHLDSYWSVQYVQFAPAWIFIQCGHSYSFSVHNVL